MMMPVFELAWLIIYGTVHNTIMTSHKKKQTIIRITLLLCTYLTIHHYWNSILRLIAVPVDRIRRRKGSRKVGWTSPERL